MNGARSWTFDAGRLVPLIFVVLYVLAVTAGTFVGGLWAGAGIAGGVLVFLATWIADGRVPRPDPAIALFSLLFLGTILLLNVHSYYPAISWHLLFQQATIVLPLAVFSSPEVQARIDKPRLWPIVAGAAFVGALALGLEFLAGAPLLHAVKSAAKDLTPYNRGISYLTVFAFPLLAFLWTTGRRWQAVAFLCVLVMPAELTDSRATRMAVSLGLATTILAAVAPRLTRAIVTIGFLVLGLMPWAVTKVFLEDQPLIRRMPPSWQHRVEIWDYMSYRIFEHPFLGWGFGSSHSLDYQNPHGSDYVWITEAAGHPHDGILQMWVELGLPGLLIGAAFALYVLSRCARLPASLRPFGYGAFVAALCVSLVAYNFWDDSLFSLFALTMLAFRSLARAGSAAASRHRTDVLR